MRATAEPVEGNLVRLSVEIEEDEIEKVMADTYRALSREMRVPGFRPGKVPRQVLEARLGGPQAVRAEALREALPDFYSQAVVESEVDPIAAPDIDITAGEESGPVSFDAVVQVRPTVSIAGYGGLRVEVPAVEVEDAEIDTEIDRMRDTEAELVEVGRPAGLSDHLTIDLHATDDTGREVVARDDFVYEVGSGLFVPELDEMLVGAKPGDVLRRSATLPGDAGQLALQVLVKDVKEKQLPELTDEWVAESSEHQSVAELRAAIARNVRSLKVLQARLALRQGALQELASLVPADEVPDLLVDRETRQRVEDLGERLGRQQLSLGQYLEATGQDPEELMAGLRDEARRVVTVDLALRALADAEAVVLDEDALARDLEQLAAREGVTLDHLRQELDRDGRMLAVRSDQRKRQALDWLIEHVELVDAEGNPVDRAALVDEDQDEGADDASTGDGAEDDRTGDTEEVGGESDA